MLRYECFANVGGEMGMLPIDPFPTPSKKSALNQSNPEMRTPRQPRDGGLCGGGAMRDW